MTAAATVQIPAPGTYRVDPAASTVTFTTRHMFGLGPVRGSFRIVSGQVSIANPVTSSTARAVIDAASVSTGDARRDADVKSANFLHVQEHPQITFESTQLVHQGDAWVLRGQITARGNGAPVELTVTEARAGENGLILRATCRVDRYAHRVTKKKGLAARYLDLEITARATAG